MKLTERLVIAANNIRRARAKGATECLAGWEDIAIKNVLTVLKTQEDNIEVLSEKDYQNCMELEALTQSEILLKAEIDALADDDLSVFHDGFFDHGAYRENRGLWWIDDGIKGLDAPGAKVRDRNRAAIEFIWP